MATREFNGTTDYLQCGGTGAALAAIANAYSIVAVIKPLVLASSGTLVSCARTTNADAIAELHDGVSSGTLGHFNYLDGSVGGAVGQTAANWQILGVTKAAGDNQFPRFHQATLGNSPPGTHADAAGSVGSQPADTWTITQFGRRAAGTNFKNYRIAVAAVFDYQLTDANYDAILSAHTTASIAALGPVALWEFNQAAVTTAVTDLIGSANQITRSGTTAVADDPVWTYGLGAPASFPNNTTVLDTFTGNEDPITSNWGDMVLVSGDTGRLAKAGGILTNATGGGTDTSGWYDVTTFGPDVEAFITITTASGVAGNQFKLLARVINPNTVNMSGYELHVEKSAGTDIWRIRRRDNVTPTQLGVDMNQEIASGDSIGLACIGNQISAYYKSGAGAWTLVGTRTDSTYAAPGVIGIKTFQASPGAWQADNLGGGTTGLAPVPSAPLSLASTPGDTQVTLTWTRPASEPGSAVTNYKIYRSTTTNTETFYATSVGTGTAYTDIAAVNGTTYFYKISAINAVGESVLSNETSATPVAAASGPETRTLKRLYGPTLLGNAAALLYTCPASTATVVRHVHASNPSGAPVNFSLSIGSFASPGTRLWDAQPIAAGDVLDHYQDFTLVAGEIIQGFAGSAATLNLTIDGYEVEAGAAPAAPIYPSDTLFPSETSP